MARAKTDRPDQRPLSVEFLGRAAKAIRVLAKKNPMQARSIKETLRVVRESRWEDAVAAKLIVPLSGAGPCVAEIRAMRAEQRLVGFWHDTQEGRCFYVTAVEAKSVLKPRRLIKLAKGAAAARRQLLDQSEG